jgi:hypothetical protein
MIEHVSSKFPASQVLLFGIYSTNGPEHLTKAMSAPHYVTLRWLSAVSLNMLPPLVCQLTVKWPKDSCNQSTGSCNDAGAFTNAYQIKHLALQ